MKPSFKDLVEKIDWVLVPKKLPIVPVHANEVAVGFFQTTQFRKKNLLSQVANEVRIRIGRDVVNSMDWKMKTRIDIYKNPDDVLTFMLVENEKGFLLQPGFKSNTFQLTFPWTESLPLTPKKCEAVEFEIIKREKKALIFRATN